MLQEPGTGTRTGYVRVRREPKTPVLQVRRKRISCQRLSCLGSQVPPVRVARGSRQPQDGWGGMRPPPKTKRKRPVREPAAAAKTQGSTAEAAVDGREEATELAQ